MSEPAAGLAASPIGHRLAKPFRVDIAQARAHCWSWLSQTLRHEVTQAQRDAAVDLLIDAAVHAYLIDAGRRRWIQVVERFDHLFTEDPAGLAQILDGLLFRAFRDTVGPLRPSLAYPYELHRDWLILTPTLPTLHDYEAQLAAMVDPEDGWVPDRHRQR